MSSNKTSAPRRASKRVLPQACLSQHCEGHLQQSLSHTLFAVPHLSRCTKAKAPRFRSPFPQTAATHETHSQRQGMRALPPSSIA